MTWITADLQPKQIILRNMVYAHGINVPTWLGCGGAKSGGKALHVDTPLATPEGWTTMANVHVGDYLFGEDGKPTRVVWKSELMHNEAVEFTFRGGSTIICDLDHQWFAKSQSDRGKRIKRTDAWREQRRNKRRTTDKQGWRPEHTLDPCKGTVVTARDIHNTLKTRQGFANWSIDLCRALELPDAPLPLDPYTLGIWLGDGSSSGGCIASADPELFAYIPFQSKKLKSKYSWRIAGLTKILNAMGLLHNKHIPQTYLRASQSQRMSLLRGLMDTDGTAKKGRGGVSFTNTNERLAHGVFELVVSLGFKATIIKGRATLYGKDCGPVWDIAWTPTIWDEPVFRLTRKLKAQKPSKWYGCNHRTIVSSRWLGLQPVQCVQVDNPSHLYLAGKSMIPTHNSAAIRRIMLDRCFSHPGTTRVIVRRLYQDLVDNHIKPYWEEFPGIKDYWVEKDKEFQFPNSSRLAFRYGENQQDIEGKFQGVEWYDIVIDEAQQFRAEELSWIKTTNRWTKGTVPAGDCKLILTFNPGDIGGDFLRRIFWVKEYQGEEKKSDYAFIHLFGWDNFAWFKELGISQDYFYRMKDVCDKETPPDFLCCRFHLFIHRTSNGKALNALAEHVRQGFLLGSFEKFGGQYFASVWDAKKILITPDQFQMLVQPWWNRWISHDDGFGHDASVIWWVQGPITRQMAYQVWRVNIPADVEAVIPYRCYTVPGKEPGELVREIRAMTSFEEVKRISRYFYSIDANRKQSTSGHSPLEIVADALLKKEEFIIHEPMKAGEYIGSNSSGKKYWVNFPYPEEPFDSRQEGWRYLYSMMKKTCDILSEKADYNKDVPMLLVAGAECQDIIDAVPYAVRNTRNPGKEDDILKKETKADDVLDSLRYGATSITYMPVKPFIVELEERRKDMSSAGVSVSQQMIVLRKIELERTRKNAGVRYKR